MLQLYNGRSPIATASLALFSILFFHYQLHCQVHLVKMQLSAIILTAFVGLSLATADINSGDETQLDRRQTCAIPNVGCYSQRDCCGGLKCDFSESCCNDSGDDNNGSFRKNKRQNCGCCRR